MTIIEKEIERREIVILGKAVKEERVAQILAELEQLESEIAGIDTDALQAEIDELKTYLPRPVEPDIPNIPGIPFI